MKKLFAVVLVALLTAAVTTASADNKSGLFSYTLKGNGTAVITGFDWAENGNNDVYVPRMIDGYSVTEIGSFAFSSSEAEYYSSNMVLFNNINYANEVKRKGIGKAVVVVLPDTIITISEKAFFCCNVTSVTIPASVKSIGEGAFSGCINITSFSVDQSNETFATIDGVLYRKAEKELVCVPAGRKSIVTIPDGIKSIGEYAFYGIDFASLYEDRAFEMPSSVVKIKANAFAYANFKREVNLNQVKEIGEHAFEHTHFFRWKADNIEKIDAYAFYGASEFYYGLRSVDELVFPASLEFIGENAFNQYRMRQSGGQPTLRTIDLSKTKIIEVSSYAFSNIRFENASCEILLPNGLECIKEHAFEGSCSYSYCVTVNLPASVSLIEDYAFYNTDIEIYFPINSNLKKIGDYAFSGYIMPKDITLPSSVESIGKHSFHCDNLDTLYIPASVTSIGQDVCDRSKTKLKAEPETYAALYASENGYMTATEDDEDTSWLSN